MYRILFIFLTRIHAYAYSICSARNSRVIFPLSPYPELTPSSVRYIRFEKVLIPIFVFLINMLFKIICNNEKNVKLTLFLLFSTVHLLRLLIQLVYPNHRCLTSQAVFLITYGNEFGILSLVSLALQYQKQLFLILLMLR